MRLRKMTAADIPTVLTLYEELFNSSKYSKYSTFDSEYVRSLLEGSFEKSPSDIFSIVGVSEAGEILGVLTVTRSASVFSTTDYFVSELAFFIKKPYRTLANIKLFQKAMREWGKLLDCTYVLFGKMPSEKSFETTLIRRL